MPTVEHESFMGISPKVKAHLLPPNMAQTAQNCWLAEGNLQCLESPSTVSALPDANRTNIYKWDRGNSSEWLSWTKDTDVVRGPIADDQYSRIYLTDGGALQMKLWYGAAVSIADVTYNPPAKPTISKAKLFDPKRITCTYNRGAIELTQSGWVWEDNILKVTFRFPRTVLHSSFYDVFRFNLKPNEDSATTVYIPSSATGTQADGYDESVTLQYGAPAVTWATLKLGKIEQTNYAAAHETSAGSYWMEHDTVVSFVVDAGRNTRQFQVYVVTLVDKYGQESPPSAVSDEVEWNVNDKLTISHTSGNSNAGEASTYSRIYRSASGAAGRPKFLFVAQVAAGAAYVDMLRDADLSEEIPLIENPPGAMSGIVSMAGGFLVAFHGRELYVSEPYMPYSWPDRYKLTLDYEIVGLAAKENDLTITTKGTPYYGSGSHPDILTITKMTLNQSCSAKRGIACVGDIVIYPSPDGLVLVSGGQAKLITEDYYTKEQWKALTPSSMIASGHDGKYIGFTSSTGIIFDLTRENGTITTTDQTATGLYQDLEDDELYMIQTSNITKWRGTSTNLQLTWWGKEHVYKQPIHPVCARIKASGYVGTGAQAMHFIVYAEGLQVLDRVVTSSKAFRLPVLRWEKKWSYKVTSYDDINELIISTSMEAMRK